MCGCTKGTNGLVNSTSCSGKVSDLHKIRNNLITLERITTDPDKKIEYKEMRSDVEQLLIEAVESCPDLQTINALKEYVENEFSIYNN